MSATAGMKKILPWMLLLLLPTLAAAAANETSQASRIQHLLSREAMMAVLNACDLPKTCGGKPPLARAEQTRESSNDVLLEEHQLRFDGLEVRLAYVLGDTGRRYPKVDRRAPTILSVKVTKPQWPIGGGLRIGMRELEVERLLGRSAGGAGCTEIESAETQGAAALCFEARRLSSIEWMPWNDW